MNAPSLLRSLNLCSIVLVASACGLREGASPQTACEAYLDCLHAVAQRSGNSLAYDQARMAFGSVACGQTAATVAACERGCEQAMTALERTGTACASLGGAADGGAADGGSSTADGGAAGQHEDTNATCSDGIDNDGDGYFDCIDYSCSRNPNVTVCNSPPPTPSFEDSNAACSDGVDNDHDGYFDCDDYDCSRNPNVTICASANETCAQCVTRVSSGACASQLSACGGNVSCQAYTQCVDACASGNATCYSACRAQDSSGAAIYDALSLCLDPYCGARC